MRKAAGLEYEASGDGEAVLLIHGALVADSFLPLAREAVLADRYRLIRYRRRGHGGSDAVSGPSSIEQQAEDAVALLTSLGVERAHVIGHSGGGTIAIELALQAPGVVRSLVVLEPAIMPPDAFASLVDAAAPVFAALESGDLAKAVDLWMIAVRAPGWRSAMNAVPGAMEQAEKDARTFFEAELPAFRDFVFDAARASRLTQPVLYMKGSESGPVFDMGKAHFQALVPHTEVVVVPGVDHLMQMAAPNAVAAPIADFLSRHRF